MQTRHLRVTSVILVGLMGLALSLLWVKGAQARAWSDEPVVDLPDLTVQVDAAPAQPQVQQPVTITVTMRNQGTLLARDFCSYLYIDPSQRPPTPATPPTYENCLHTSLYPGYTYSWSKTSIVFSTAGSHVLCAWVDRDNTITESNETNNLVCQDLIVGAPPACESDAYEADNGCANARLVAADGAHYRHTLCPVGDQDWIQVNMVQGLRYVITTENVGADGDTKLDLYDTCEQPPLASNDPTLGPGAQLPWDALVTGPYFIRVMHHASNYGPDTHYDLSVQSNCSGDNYEPDNTCQIGREITPNGPTQDHLFCAPADDDWLRFDAQAGQTYQVSLEAMGAAAQPRLSLYQACGGTPLLETGVGQSLSWAAQASGTVYVRVRDDTPSTVGPTANYRVRLTASGTTGDAFEPDNAPNLAKQIATTGAAQNHTFAPAGDQDWLYFDAAAGQPYRLETFDLGPAADTVLCLYSSGGATQVACDDDGGEGKGSLLSWTFAVSGRYYLKIRDYRPDAGGGQASYRVAVAASARVCDPDAWEPDDSAFQARAIATDGAWQRHNACPQNDVDWVRLLSTNSRAYTIETANLGPDADTVLSLVDSDGHTVLWRNDDAGAGRGSSMLWNVLRDHIYYVRIESFGAGSSGRGTGYDLRVAPAPLTPTPSSTPAPTSTPTPTPTSSPTPTETPLPNAHTLIVTHRGRLQALYGQAAVQALDQALTRLAGAATVKGMVVDVGQDQAAAQVVAAWVADLTNADKANRVADAVRNVVLRQWAHSPDLAYIVLVGDDRVIPYRRIADRPEITRIRERDYPDVSPGTSVGAALQANMSLNDDFYADRSIETWEGQPAPLPEVAIGRLVEAPSDIISAINAYLAQPTTIVSHAMVAGYGALQNGAEDTCARWERAGVRGFDCALVGDRWDVSDLRDWQWNRPPRFDLQAWGIPTRHYREQAPDEQFALAQELAASTADLRGVVIASVGSHSGLNVPPANSVSPLDLPEVLVRKGVTYAANTGRALAGRDGVQATELLMHLFTRELAQLPNVSVGEAWQRAKLAYRQQAGTQFNEYDRKVLNVSTLFGLPMMLVNATNGTFGDEFPSADVGLDGGPLGDVISRTLTLNLRDSFGSLALSNTAAGDFFSLDDHVAYVAAQAAQPQFFADTAGWSNVPPRGVVWTGGIYRDILSFTPLRDVVMAVGDSLSQQEDRVTTEDGLGAGWSPAAPVSLAGPQGNGFNVFLGQYDETHGRERIYGGMTFDAFFSVAPDQTPPVVSWVAGERQGQTAVFKVEASDVAGILAVYLTYTRNDGAWHSLPLQYDAAMQKWTGSLPLLRPLTWIVQVVDGAGNVTTANNKGLYFQLDLPYAMYLPRLAR